MMQRITRERLLAFALVFLLLSNVSVLQAQIPDTSSHPRRIVYITSAVIKSIDSLKQSWSPVEKKLQTNIHQILRQYSLNGNSFIFPVPQTDSVRSAVKVDTAGRVYCYIYKTKQSIIQALYDTLTALQIPIVEWNNNINFLQAWVPINALGLVAGITTVGKIRAISDPLLHAGTIESQGVSRMRANVASQVWPMATGDGVKVGILSDDCGSTEADPSPFSTSVDGAEILGTTSIADDSYSPSADEPSRTHEGLAMMEIIQDVAPKANLYFATAFGGIVSFINNIQSLASDHECKVIVDDVSYHEEPAFEDGELADQIDDVVATYGVSYCVAAGNRKQSLHSFTFDNVAHNIAGSPATVNDFGGGDWSLPFGLPGNSTVTIVLQWDDSFDASSNNFNLYLVNNANTIIRQSSVDVQDASGGQPLEMITFTNSSASEITLRIMVNRLTATTNPTPRMKLDIYYTGISSSPPVVNGEKSVIGHCAASKAISCGAVRATDDNYFNLYEKTPEGPVDIVNTSAAVVIAHRPLLESRKKPDVASFTNCQTSLPAFAAFSGTSASAPHVAGLAALLKSVRPTLSYGRIKSSIKVGAIDYGDIGADNSYGAGRTDAFRTIAQMLSKVSKHHHYAVFKTPTLFCPAPASASTPTQISSQISLSGAYFESKKIDSIYVSVTVDGINKAGALRFRLTYSPALAGIPKTLLLMDQPVSTASTTAIFAFNPNIVFGDKAEIEIHDGLTSMTEAIGFYQPETDISAPSKFPAVIIGGGCKGMKPKGFWKLYVYNYDTAKTCTLKDWGLYFKFK